MACASCGCDLAAGAQFCVRCGQRTAQPEPQGWGPVMANASAMPGIPLSFGRETRLEQHVQTLGAAWCIFGAWRLVAMTALTRNLGDYGMMGHHVHMLVSDVVFTTFFFSALALVAGIGLLTRKSWARGLALFLGFLCLVKLPVGTALGIYTFWVLGSRGARRQWREMQVKRELW